MSSSTPQEKANVVKDRIKSELTKEREANSSAKNESIPNPFVYEGPLWTSREFLLVLCGIVVIPIRMILIMILMCISTILMKISISGDFDHTKPMSGWRRAVQKPVAWFCRILLFICGFYWIDVEGKPCSSKEARLVIFAPHSTIFDTFYLVYAYNYPSAISKIENLSLPLAGISFRAMQAVAVDRADRSQKDSAVNALVKHASNENERHLVMAPEGTCTNRKALITFKRGAFAPGQPLQPVCLEWPWTGFDLTWTAGGPNRLGLAFHALCQPHLKLKVTFLPVYYPNEEEKKDHILFASNVRDLMAKTLGIPCTGHSYEDMFLAKEARKLHVPLGQNIPFELHELSTLYNISLQDAKDLLKRYASIYKNSELIDGPGLANILGIPYNAPVKELFDLLKEDKDDVNGIDFKQLLIGVTHLSKALNTANIDESIELVWQTISDGKSEVTERQIHEKLSHVFAGFSRIFSKRMFKNADSERKGKVNYQAFKDFLLKHPELLFVAVETIAQREKGRRLSVLKSPKQVSKEQVGSQPIVAKEPSTTN